MRKSMQTVLGENLAALMKGSREHSSPKKLGLKIGMSKSTVERIRAGQVACQVDTLAAIAAAFELQPWQLLVDNLDPRNPPMLRHEDEKLKNLYASLQVAMDRIAEYERGDSAARPR